METTFNISSKHGAAALEHPTSRRILLKLVVGAYSLSELSRHLNLSLSLLTYHVDRLRRLGFVRLAREASVTGRPIRRYRAVAKEFFVPAEMASRSSVNALAEELRNGLEQNRIRHKRSGTLYLIDDKGRRLVKAIGGGVRGTTFEAWIITELSTLDAKQFGNDLRAMLSKYPVPKTGKVRPFLFHCAMAPRKRG